MNYFLLTACVCTSFFLSAQAQEVTQKDYERAVSLMWNHIENKTAFNLSVNVHWLPDESGGWFVTHSADGKAFQKVLFSNFQVTPLFDHQRVAEALGKVLEQEVKADSLPFDEVEYRHEDSIFFEVEEKVYQLNPDTYAITEWEEDADEDAVADEFESRSPDGQWIAYAEDYNLYLKSTESGEVRQLSTAGEKNYEYGSFYGWFDMMEGEGGERPQQFSVNWSPDSKWIQTNICDLRNADKMYLLDWSVDSLYRPRLLSYYRGSPGDTTMVHMHPVFFEVESGKEIKPELPPVTHINAVAFRWAEEAGKVYAQYNERGFQKVQLLSLDLSANELKPLITESSKTNIDNFDYQLIAQQDKILFTSERSGWKQLYLHDLESAETRPLTQGEYYVNSVVHTDEEKGVIYFTASGKEAGCNPYHERLYSIRLDGKNLKPLTPEDAHHDLSFSPDGKYFVDNYSTATQPTITVLREAKTGKVKTEIAQADVEQLIAQGWNPPQIFEVLGRDGKTPIYGALWKPTHFDASKTYPLIDHSYSGPHTQMFPQSFSRAVRTSNQALAELGFIVMMVDGMGSAGRSKAFHDVSYKHMGENLTDHVLAIEQLGKQYRWIDTSRVGIFGHSAGGYDAAHALLQFPEVYKVGVASSGDHDFRMEKAWWPEMYMGWPVDSTYHLQSNITMAENLQGKLLLVHGALDNNVNPSATFKLAEALVKADKEFDMLILPSQQHGYSGQHSGYFLKKRWNYFVEHLLGAEPLWNFAFE
ncbi:S9 family peptidase [Catalinimonas niigatensis]|uniref:S9 family peptidase n=1 Tax=Catalinimonas niigatensis TaxID=1397264 RepID=UPI0026650222|nr:prolyl oligopeptidase family serine peptidase [Catalinimonas niigatensis]WPP52765.1 DPP IV N-terminal domain-containing protein [Catalinimonas niigatensis]